MNAFDLSDAYVDAMAAVWPVMATFQGVPGHDAEWTDYSPQGVERARATLKDFRQQAKSLERSDDFWQRLAADWLVDIADRNLLFYGTTDCLKDLNNIDSPAQHLRMVFDVTDTSTPQGWDNVIQRLHTIDGAAASYKALLEHGRQVGEVASARQVRTVIEQCRVHAGDDSFFNTLLTAEGADRTRVAPGVQKARAAYADLADYLERDYLPDAAERDAVGRERYAREVRRFLGADVDLEETYEWGWSEVRRLQAEMGRVAREIDADASLDQVLSLMKTDPSRCASSREEFLRVMTDRQERALRDLQGVHFDVPSEVQAVQVKMAPAGGPLGAYYIPPSEDFTRQGSIWYSLGDTLPIPLWDQVSTAYHEGFPGHHLQCGLQVSLRERLGKAQRLDGWSGYAEGWALYTERLMDELGYYEKPDYLLGMLACQMMRACRVVIDIGSHLELRIPDDAPFHPGQRWTYDLGVEMLVTLGGMQRDHAESEIVRYLGWPGQAISYKVGERLILDLREEMQLRMGGQLSLKTFHDRVLGCGNVALERLRALVLG